MKKSDKLHNLIKEFFDENPEALDLLPPTEDGYLFSSELRTALEPFKKMKIDECLRSKDFMKALCNHAGMSDEEFDAILTSNDDK